MPAGDGVLIPFERLLSWTRGGLMPGTIRLDRRTPPSRSHSPHLPSHRFLPLFCWHLDASLSGQQWPSQGFFHDRQEVTLIGCGEPLSSWRGHLPKNHFLLAAAQESRWDGTFVEHTILLTSSNPHILASLLPDLRGDCPTLLGVFPSRPDRWSISILASILISFNSTYEARHDESALLPF